MVYYEVFTDESIQHELALDEAEYRQLQAKLDDNGSGGDIEAEMKILISLLLVKKFIP